MNMRTTLLDPESGRKMVMLGGDFYKQYKKGDLIVEFKWVDEEPVMILYKRTLGANSPAYMIEMKDAHQYALSNGEASKSLVCELGMQAANALGCHNDRATAFRIIDAIVNFLPDLIKMPPAPKEIILADAPSRGEDELTIKVDGKVIAEVLV